VHSDGVSSMSDVTVSDAAVVQYVVEFDGSKHSEHAYFVEITKTALLLREQNPESKIKVHDIFESKSESLRSELAA
jgi:hypothetical protein